MLCIAKRKLFSPLFVVVHSQLRRSQTRKVVNNWTTFEAAQFVLPPTFSTPDPSNGVHAAICQPTNFCMF